MKKFFFLLLIAILTMVMPGYVLAKTASGKIAMEFDLSHQQENPGTQYHLSTENLQNGIVSPDFPGFQLLCPVLVIINCFKGAARW